MNVENNYLLPGFAGKIVTSLSNANKIVNFNMNSTILLFCIICCEYY